jgi:hypothetical protein
MTEELENEVPEIEEEIEQPEEEAVEDSEGDAEEQPEESAEKPAEPDNEELEKKRQAYLERERKRLEKAKATPPAPEPAKTNEADEVRAAAEELKRWHAQQQQIAIVAAAKKELEVLENDYKQVAPDYDTKVNRAMNIMKKRYMSKGLSEAEATQRIEMEKLIHAANAEDAGESGVAAIEKEADTIISWFDSVAVELGYIPAAQKKLTKAAAQREAGKPNASGGRGTAAYKGTFDEEDDLNEIRNTPLGAI